MFRHPTKRKTLCLFLFFLIPPLNLTLDPDETLTFAQLIDSRGYHLLAYRVTTEDGYILTVHRIVPRDFDASTYSNTHKPVILFHGIVCQSPVFFYNSPKLEMQGDKCSDNFGFCLLKTGRYDVWVPNARGNGLSNGHVKLDYRYDSVYWNFSFEQIGLYDVPAVIDLVLGETGHPNLGYVGYSQGAGSLFALLSQEPEYAHKISTFVSWAPAVYLGHARTRVRPLMMLNEPLYRWKSGQFFFTDLWFNNWSQGFCAYRVNDAICEHFLSQVFGPSNRLNRTRLPVYTHFSPSPCSRWQIAHFAQLGSSGTFSRFDYQSENYQVYGQATPPEFKFACIPKNIPTMIAYGATDWFIDQTDVQKLIRELRGLGWEVVKEHRVAADIWNHFDFLTGQGAGELVNDQTLAFLDQFY